MSVQYFAKVTNMQDVEVAVAHNDNQAKALRDQKFEQCSRTFYESTLRNAGQHKLVKAGVK